MNFHIFDIETGPQPQTDIFKIIPPFDPADVKYGNIKDPDKIAAKIDECREKYYSDALDNAALNAMTGRVLAIGIQPVGGHPVIIGHEKEDDILLEFWNLFSSTPGKWVGFNIFGFDLPFLMRRSWANQLKVPFIRKGRYWSDEFIDLRETWQAGDRQAEGSLDSISRALGIGQKSGDGADFARLWKTERAKAEEYLRHDLELTTAVFSRIQAN